MNPLRKGAVLFGAIVLFAGGGLIASADAPADACESVSSSAIDTVQELKAYDDCRFDRIEAKLDGSVSPTPTPTVTPTNPAPTTPAPTTPTPTPTVTPSPPVVQPNAPITVGALLFRDEFNGTSLDTQRWAPSWFKGSKMNEVATSPSNVAVRDGSLILTLSSKTTGALVNTNPDDVAPNPFEFKYGYAEARVLFPGSGSTIYNWPAWWINGQNHPEDGEHDIAEGLGTLTVNYHSPSGAHNQGTIPGTWSNAFHTYGVNRQPGKADVYWDGKLVKSYKTDDSGNPEYLILNVGTKSSRTTVLGAAGAVKVDYVRVWAA